MSTAVVPRSPAPIVYPDSDGEPMAENTLRFDWITKIKGGLGHLFAGDPSVFVAGDLFWYPVEGRPDIRLAPDAMVVFGRPKGHRGSYRQWEEAHIAPQVVFEVLSPSNRFGEMLGKFQFYQQYGVEEYYICNPEPFSLELTGYLRRRNTLVQIASMSGHVSPRLGIRFEMGPDGLRIIRPDGKSFVTYEELAETNQELAEDKIQLARQNQELLRRNNELTQTEERLRSELEKLHRRSGDMPDQKS